ncbi:MAG: hypothetical protein ACLGHK_09825 [Alphaproteobacteria bacterium]
MLRLLVPKRVGGFGLSTTDFCRVQIEIAKGDPAVSWVMQIEQPHHRRCRTIGSAPTFMKPPCRQSVTCRITRSSSGPWSPSFPPP